MTKEEYIEFYRNLTGSAVVRIKEMLAYFSDNWQWDGHASLVSDLLDDDNVSAEEIVQVLAASAGSESACADFATAVAAFKDCLRLSKSGMVSREFDPEQAMQYSPDLSAKVKGKFCV